VATELAVLVRDGVEMLIVAETRTRRLPSAARDRVRCAFFDRSAPEAERRAAKQAIASALRTWVETHAEIGNDEADIADIARALAVTYALDDQLNPGMPSSDDTARDRDIALCDLQEYVRQRNLGPSLTEECKELGEILSSHPRRPTVARRVISSVKPLLVATVALFTKTHSRSSETVANARVLDPDPWWAPATAAPATSDPSGKLTADGQAALLASLLTVYSTQFGSYTSLLWQVPALGLTAQAFLLTIALSAGNNNLAKVIASVLSILIAVASSRLMHDQRGHAINHGELALRVSKQLRLAPLLGTLKVEDAEPPGIDAETVWVGWDHRIYGVWRTTLMLFVVADIVVLLSLVVSAVDH
jgi:hypothetical protein